MADFNAGSIEGTVDLDLDPFTEGLRLAKAQAAEFEGNDIVKTVRIKTVQEGNQPSEVQDEHATATVGLDDSALHRGLDEDNLELDKIGAKKVKPTVEVDTDKAIANIRRFASAMDGAIGAYNAHGNPLSGGGGGGHGLLYLIGLAAALAPALGPATAALGLFSAAGIAGFIALGVAAAGYAKIAASAFSQIQEAIKAGKQLPGVAGEAETAFKGLSTEWDKFQKAVDPGVFRVMTAAFTQLASILPEFEPLINAMSRGLTSVVNQLGRLFKRDDAQEFLATMTRMADKDLPKLGKIAVHVLGGLMDLFDSLSPVINRIVNGLVRVTGEFEKWANLKSNSFVKDTLGDIEKYAPQGEKLLHNLFATLKNIITGLAPLTGPALDFLVALTGALAGLDLAPLARGIGSVLEALSPFVTVIGQLVNILLPPLGTLLQTLADDFVGPLGHSLLTELTPAFQAVADVLNFLAPYLGEVISSFADLVNPTGVGALARLLTGLKTPIETLVPPLAQVVLALEGLVDKGIEALMPLMPAFISGLTLVSEALALLLKGLAWFLQNKVVVDIILGLVGAFLLLTSPIAATVAALTLFGLAADFLIAHWGSIKGFFTDTWHAIKHGAQDVWDWISDHWPALLGILIGPFGPAVVEIIKHWDTVKTFFHDLPGKIRGYFSGAASWLVQHGKDILNGLKSGAQAAWQNVSSWLSARKNAVTGFFSGAAGWLVSEGKDVFQGMKSGAQSAWASLSSWLSGLKDKILGFFDGIDLTAAGYKIISSLGSGFIKAAQKVYSTLSGIGNKIKGFVPGSPVKEGPLRVFNNGYAGRKLIEMLADGMNMAAPGLYSQAKDLAGGLNDALAGAGINLSSGRGTLTLTGGKTLMTGFTSLSDAVADLAVKQADLSSAVAGIAPAVGSAVADATNGHKEAVTEAFESATEKQTNQIIQAQRSGR